MQLPNKTDHDLLQSGEVIATSSEGNRKDAHAAAHTKYEELEAYAIQLRSSKRKLEGDLKDLNTSGARALSIALDRNRNNTTSAIAAGAKVKADVGEAKAEIKRKLAIIERELLENKLARRVENRVLYPELPEEMKQAIYRAPFDQLIALNEIAVILKEIRQSLQ